MRGQIDLIKFKSKANADKAMPVTSGMHLWAYGVAHIPPEPSWWLASLITWQFFDLRICDSNKILIYGLILSPDLQPGNFLFPLLMSFYELTENDFDKTTSVKQSALQNWGAPKTHYSLHFFFCLKCDLLRLLPAFFAGSERSPILGCGERRG